jgi:DNA-directed RNA polymerase specialized sigma24 family protein
METVARNVFEPEAEDGRVLERLWHALVRWLRPRIRCAATGMDIASETVHRAIRRFCFRPFSGSAAGRVG